MAGNQQNRSKTMAGKFAVEDPYDVLNQRKKTVVFMSNNDTDSQVLSEVKEPGAGFTNFLSDLHRYNNNGMEL